jgi:hypothetical protein
VVALTTKMSVTGGDQCEGKEEVKKSHMFDEPPPTPILGDLHTKDHLGYGAITSASSL